MMKKSRSLYCQHVPDIPAPPPGYPHDGWKVTPSAQETELLKVIRETITHFQMKTIPRVAGGWVRDKLLNKGSHDLDIALDDCNGEDFANKINEYLSSKGEVTKTVGVIQANPEQSKHLATATLKIHGMEVDFVNLRSEIYETDSRIPKIEIGTPHEDAMRRDFTVNSIFYNIMTEQVEDLTGRGLEDLENGILRTPLPAGITFRDDPLRMLRAIRFAARYGFRLEEGVCNALANEGNAAALSTKVSNERVGIEINKSLQGERPRLALELVIAHGLADAVFKVPVERFIGDRVQVPPRVDWITCLRIVDSLVLLLGDNASTQPDPTSLYLAAVLFPLGNSQFVAKKGKKESVVKQVVGNSLKLSNQHSEKVYSIIIAASELSLYLIRDEMETDRVSLGRLLFEVKESWGEGLTLAVAVLQAARSFSKDEEEYVNNVMRRSKEIREKVNGPWNLDKVWDRLQKDPILDGNELMSFLKIKGAEVRKAVILVRDFAFLNNPPQTDEERILFVDKAKEYVLQNWKI